ncbi:MAG: serine hydrolase [Alphaproteobacteria bacterium]|nr:serine hydrolase [Alphaproteobacteria bacterium]
MSAGLDATVAGLTASWSAGDAPGGVVALFDAGGIRSSWCLGLADLASRRPWSLDTPTRLASISKHICASAAQRLGLAGRIGDTLGELARPVADTTVASALTMTSGVPDLAETLTLSGVSWMGGIDAERLFALACRLDHLNFAAGSEVSYSNTNTRLVQRMIERRTGMPLRRWLDENLFAPLGLSSFALVEDQTECVPGLATGYWFADGAPRFGWYGLHYSGSGGIVASAQDLASWLRALAAGSGPLAGLLAELGEVGVLADGTRTAYARGLTQTPIGDRVFLGHGGSLPGYKDHCLVDPRSGLGIVVLSNREDTEAETMAATVMAAHLGATIDWRRPAAMTTGLFVDPANGHTLELADAARGPTAAFLGAEEKLYLAEDGTWTSRSAHLPIRIAPTALGADEIQASIGNRPPIGFRRARAATSDDLAGSYRCAALDARHEIALRSEGPAIRFGGGPAPAAWESMTPTAPDCFTTQTPPLGPWRLRPALKFDRDAAGRVRGFMLSSNRSRGWRFERDRGG